MKRLHLIISGQVQGVGFRAATQREATRLGLKGWVKNLSNGNVESVVEGNEKLLKDFEQWCRQGPPMSEVIDVKTRELPATGEFTNFSFRF